jgi:hypothetical protein
MIAPALPVAQRDTEPGTELLARADQPPASPVSQEPRPHSPPGAAGDRAIREEAGPAQPLAQRGALLLRLRAARARAIGL